MMACGLGVVHSFLAAAITVWPAAFGHCCCPFRHERSRCPAVRMGTAERRMLGAELLEELVLADGMAVSVMHRLSDRPAALSERAAD